MVCSRIYPRIGQKLLKIKNFLDFHVGLLDFCLSLRSLHPRRAIYRLHKQGWRDFAMAEIDLWSWVGTT